MKTKLFRSYKQSQPMECMACVAAMATGTTPQDFVGFLKTEYPDREISPPYNDVYFQRYLLEFDMIVGVGLGLIGRDPEGEVHGAAFYPLKGQPALVSVKNENHAYEHALYWDGNQIWDPDPDTDDGFNPLFYRISGWWPIIKIPFGRTSPG